MPRDRIETPLIPCLRRLIHDRLGLIGEVEVSCTGGNLYTQWTVFRQFRMTISCPATMLRSVPVDDLARDAAGVLADMARRHHGMSRPSTFADYALERNEELAS